MDQWGTNAWTTMDSAFSGAVNLTVPATDIPDFSAVTSMSGMFASATSANPDTSGWDTSVVTNMSSMFSGATSANPDTSGWNTSAVTDMSYMFSGTTSFDRDIGSWDVTSLINATRMFNAVTLSTTNYDSLLVGWHGQVLKSAVEFGADFSKYRSAAAIAARANMIASDSWVIQDYGQDCTGVTYTVGGDVSGLTGSGLVLQNNADDDLAISVDGGFTFDTALNYDSTYVVTILTQPSNPNQICRIFNASGTLDGADIVDVSVVCEAWTDNIFTDGFEEQR